MAEMTGGDGRASTSTLAPFRAPEFVTAALAKAKTDGDDAVWKAATEAALVWLLSLAPASPTAAPDSSDKGKAKEEPDNLVHWFCGKQGAEDCYEPAVFLIRLFAFKRTGQIDTWRRTFEKLTSTCCDCVRHYQLAKQDFQTIYLTRTKSDKAIVAFMDALERIELQSVTALFALAGHQITPPDAPPPVALVGIVTIIPVVAIYSVLVNIRLFQNDQMVELLKSALPHRPIAIPPIVSPGLVAFLAHEDRDINAWSRSQMKLCREVAAAEYTSHQIETVVNSHFHVLGCRARGEDDTQSSLNFPYTTTRLPFWEATQLNLSKLSSEVVSSRLVRRDSQGDIVRLVASHLGDQKEHFPAVLGSWKVLLEKLGPAIWAVGDGSYYEVVLHAILDNSLFESEFMRLSRVDQSTYPFTSWIRHFLLSVALHPDAFKTSLAMLTQTFLDRFQKQRFPVIPRNLAVDFACTFLTSVFVNDSFSPTTAWPYADEADSNLELHVPFLAQLAFSPQYSTDEWKLSAKAALRLIGSIGARDSRRLVENTYALATYDRDWKAFRQLESEKGGQRTETEPTPPLMLRIASPVWRATYAALRDDDMKGIIAMLESVAGCSHLEKINSSSWMVGKANRKQTEAVNEAMDAIRTPLLSRLDNLVNERNTTILHFLGPLGGAQHLVRLLFSPVEPIHQTAAAIIKEAFDVTSRQDCFRSLLLNFPAPTFVAISTVLDSFIASAKVIPEVCGMAKRLVRCLLDVINVLCDPALDGLLHDPAYRLRLSEEGITNRLAKYWKAICGSLALVFQRTPSWAAHYPADTMTEWMRDAIGFGNKLIEQVHTIEMVVRGSNSASPSKSPGSSRKMIIALNRPLEDLLGWLRLTDVELLMSSFELVRSTIQLFNRSAVLMSSTVVDKVKKLAASAEKKRKSGERPAIDSQSLLLLLDEQGLEDDGTESDVEVLSAKPASKVEKNGKAVVRKVGEKSKDQSWFNDALDKKSKAPASSTEGSPWLNIARPGTGISVKTVVAKSNVKTAAKPAPKPMRGVPWTTYKSAQAASSSSDDDSDAGDPNQLEARYQQPLRPKATERRTIKRIDVGGGRQISTVSRQKQREADSAANYARLRSAPDYSPLHRIILQWDFMHNGDCPPDTPGFPTRLPPVFANTDEYFDGFQPLLLVECWEAILSAKRSKEEVVSIPCVVGNRQATDDFTDVFLTISHDKLPDRRFLSESDLVLMRRGDSMTLGKIQTTGRTREFFSLTVRCHFGNDVHGASDGMHGRSEWSLIKLYSMATIHREYAALLSLPYLDLVEDILYPRPPPIVEVDSREVERTMTAYEVNKPQAMAILGSLQHQGFSLIQGPPGTGKTKTIVGLIGALIASAANAIPANQNGYRRRPGKVLLCAPSNAAVDEVAKRLKAGIRGSDGRLFYPKVVRIGSESSVEVGVRDIFIDELILQELSGTSGNGETPASIATKQQLESARRDRFAKQAEYDAVENNAAGRAELFAELKKIKATCSNLAQRLDSERDQEQQSKRAMEVQKVKARSQILSGADVICSTLSGSGHDYMNEFDFETVIIDEAAQSIELSSLIPLRYGCKRCILVGDPNQLPPTVMSRVATAAGYEKSLFVRMMDRGGPTAVHLLSIQYRMHPNISTFPSSAFYNSRLTDGPGIELKTQQPWHDSPLFPPYAFMHVRGGAEKKDPSGAISNFSEAATAVALYDRLRRDYPSINFDHRIAIVTPYKGQVREMRRQFRSKFGEDILNTLSFNTVDGFQGQEKDIIILSCVRGGSADTAIGFLSDTRRMNVALTRAKSSLFILGDSAKLRSNVYWANLVVDAESRGLMRQVDVSTFRSQAPLGPPTVRTAIAITKSKAKAILSAPTPPAALRKPKEVSAQSTAARKNLLPVASGSGNVRKRISAAMELDTAPPAPKRPKQDNNAPPQVVTAPKAAPPVARAPPTGAQRPPPVVPAVRKAPPKTTSLFVPKKRPAVKTTTTKRPPPPPPGRS